jgi:hypothetical protein
MAAALVMRSLPSLLAWMASMPEAYAAPGVQWAGIEKAEFVASSTSPGSVFGNAVSISGDTAVVGAFLDDLPGAARAGSAGVYMRIGSSWQHDATLLADDVDANDFFGYAVSVSGDTVVIGAPASEGGNNTGAAYVFVRNGSEWTQQTRLEAFDGGPGNSFGNSVSIHLDTIVVGAEGDDAYAGSAYVFVRSRTLWSFQAKLRGLDTEAGDRLGRSVSVSGDTIVAGADSDAHSGHTSAGSAYVFVRSGASWGEQQKLIADDASFGDIFGASVALEGDTVLIAAPWDDYAPCPSVLCNYGSVYVFVRAGSTWSQQDRIAAPVGVDNDQFGWSVALDGDTALLGRMRRSDPLDPGSAFVLRREGASWTTVVEIAASNSAPLDRFGTAVGISASTMLIGASLHGTTGSAYVFILCEVPEALCFGNDVDCPCANGGLPDRGCENAATTGGVRLDVASFCPDGVGGGTATLVGTGFPTSASPTVIAIRGSGPGLAPFGDGVLCLDTTTVRVDTSSASAGVSSQPMSHGAGTGTFFYQLWYRSNPRTYCDPTAAFNLSNATRITWP